MNEYIIYKYIQLQIINNYNNKLHKLLLFKNLICSGWTFIHYQMNEIIYIFEIEL